MTVNLDKLKYDAHGLIPAIIQDAHNKKVLMMAYMNKESLAKTLETGTTWFYSRSRQKFWNKGETSGHFQYVKSVSYDCDADTLLIMVEQVGVACHTGANSCFFNDLPVAESADKADGKSAAEQASVDAVDSSILAQLSELIKQRKVEMPEGSYTTYLFNKGEDKILKKVGEETAEILIAAKGGKREEVVYETGDLLYHLLVMLAQYDIDLEEVWAELKKRH